MVRDGIPLTVGGSSSPPLPHFPYPPPLLDYSNSRVAR